MKRLLLSIPRYLSLKFVDQNSPLYWVTAYIKQNRFLFRLSLSLFRIVNRGSKSVVSQPSSRPVRLLDSRGLEIFTVLTSKKKR